MQQEYLDMLEDIAELPQEEQAAKLLDSMYAVLLKTYQYTQLAEPERIHHQEWQQEFYKLATKTLQTIDLMLNEIIDDDAVQVLLNKREDYLENIYTIVFHSERRLH